MPSIGPGVRVALQFIDGIMKTKTINPPIIARTVKMAILNTALFTFSISKPRNPRGLVPDADSEGEAYVVDDPAFSAREIRRLTELAGVRYRDVRREFATDFVTQAQTGIEL